MLYERYGYLIYVLAMIVMIMVGMWLHGEKPKSKCPPFHVYQQSKPC